jgi:hypothetical protein
MAVFDHLEFDQRERVVFTNDRKSQLRAIVASRDRTLGPPAGSLSHVPYNCGEVVR